MEWSPAAACWHHPELRNLQEQLESHSSTVHRSLGKDTPVRNIIYDRLHELAALGLPQIIPSLVYPTPENKPDYPPSLSPSELWVPKVTGLGTSGLLFTTDVVLLMFLDHGSAHHRLRPWYSTPNWWTAPCGLELILSQEFSIVKKQVHPCSSCHQVWIATERTR